MQRNLSNKENLPANNIRKQNAPHGNNHKKAKKSKGGKSSSQCKSHRGDHSSTQRELSLLKSEVKKMRKEVQLFKTYYLTQPQSLHDSLPSPSQDSKARSLSTEDYLINSSHLLPRDQSRYYIQYYLEN